MLNCKFSSICFVLSVYSEWFWRCKLKIQIGVIFYHSFINFYLIKRKFDTYESYRRNQVCQIWCLSNPVFRSGTHFVFTWDVLLLHYACCAFIDRLLLLLCSGLTTDEIEQLASLKMPMVKVSRRDLTPVLSQVSSLCMFWITYVLCYLLWCILLVVYLFSSTRIKRLTHFQ